MTKKIPTHSIENLTNSPYPMRTKAGYDRIVPAYTKIEDIPADAFMQNVNPNFWKIEPLALSDEAKAAILAQEEETRARAEEEARMVAQAEQDAIDAQAAADKEAADKAAADKEAADKAAAAAAADAKKGEKK